MLDEVVNVSLRFFYAILCARALVLWIPDVQMLTHRLEDDHKKRSCCYALGTTEGIGDVTSE